MKGYADPGVGRAQQGARLLPGGGRPTKAKARARPAASKAEGWNCTKPRSSQRWAPRVSTPAKAAAACAATTAAAAHGAAGRLDFPQRSFRRDRISDAAETISGRLFFRQIGSASDADNGRTYRVREDERCRQQGALAAADSEEAQ